MNKSQETPIPYVKQNQKNKLRQLAQKNNREFKKLLPGKSQYFGKQKRIDKGFSEMLRVKM